jgi:hypothetical protein
VAKVIGNADEFYRLRVIHVDEGDVPDLEWRDDILYRRPAGQPTEEYDVWRVEAVDLDDDERVTVLGKFGTADEAHAAYDSLSDDLAVMTRAEFERAYFPEHGDAAEQ